MRCRESNRVFRNGAIPVSVFVSVFRYQISPPGELHSIQRKYAFSSSRVYPSFVITRSRDLDIKSIVKRNFCTGTQRGDESHLVEDTSRSARKEKDC